MALNIHGFQVEDHTVDDTIERYVFDRPVGGYWSIRASVYTDCDRIQAYYQPLDISTAMVSHPQPVIPRYDLTQLTLLINLSIEPTMENHWHRIRIIL